MGSSYFKKRIRAIVRPHNLLSSKAPKAFKSEESAKKWAKANNQEGCAIRQVKEGKFKIVH